MWGQGHAAVRKVQIHALLRQVLSAVSQPHHPHHHHWIGISLLLAPLFVIGVSPQMKKIVKRLQSYSLLTMVGHLDEVYRKGARVLVVAPAGVQSHLAVQFKLELTGQLITGQELLAVTTIHTHSSALGRHHLHLYLHHHLRHLHQLAGMMQISYIHPCAHKSGLNAQFITTQMSYAKINLILVQYKVVHPVLDEFRLIPVVEHIM